MSIWDKLSTLFKKEKGDEDPIVIEDSDEPIIETTAKPEVSVSVQSAEDPLKNISTIPKNVVPEATKVEVVEVPKAPEVAPVAPAPVAPVVAEKSVVKPKKPRYDSDGFTSTRSLY